MSTSQYLIVDQKAKPPENLPDLLKALSSRFKLDIYQCRQRLIGRGLALLAKGPSTTLEKISLLLADSTYDHWLVEPSKPQFAPFRLRSLRVDEYGIELIGVDERVQIERGCRVMAVFADLSGKLAEKSVQQLLSSHAWRGRDDIRHIADDKVLKTIIQGQPVLDIYRLDDDNNIVAATRLLPGKFDAKGLGDRATLSSKQNLLKVIETVRDYAGEFHFYRDFGLVNLPGCTLQNSTPDAPETLRKNLTSLTRYGWLMGDLLHVEKRSQVQPQEDAEDGAATAAAAILTGNSTLLTNPDDPAAIMGKQIAEELCTEAKNAANPSRQTTLTNNKGLPAPPPAAKQALWSNPRFWLGGAGTIACGLFFIIAQQLDHPLLRNLAAKAFASGIIPLFVAGLLFYYSFYFLRLKRLVEDTPTSRIRSVAMGMVEIKGKALRKYALVAPMSNAPCVYYRLTKYRRENNKQWKVSSISSSDHVPFLVEDETGRVEVDPRACRVRAMNKQEGLPGQIGLWSSHSDGDEKWIEETVLDGTLIYVLGFAATRRDNGPDTRELRSAALRDLKRNPDKLKEYDSDGDGRISEEEWDAARSSVEDQVTQELLASRDKRKKQEEHIVIGKKQGLPMIISETHSEDQLTTRYLYYAIPLIIAAALATGGAIYLLVNFLKG